MSFSRMYERPSRLHDVLGYLQWEYDKIRLLTMLPSARFHYKRAGSRGKEIERGAASSAFCFAAIYGSDGTRRTLRIDGKTARSQCIARFINPLRKMQEAFNRTGTLSSRVKFKEEDCVDEVTRTHSLLHACYITDVLLGWYQRIIKIMEIKLHGHNGDGLMSVSMCVPETRITQAAWDWAQAKVLGYQATHTADEGCAPNYIKFFIKCVNEIQRPDDATSDPGGWRFSRGPDRQSGCPPDPPQPPDDAGTPASQSASENF